MSDESRLRTGAGLSSFWDGTPVKRVRGGDGVSILKGRRLSLHVMVQPGIAEGLLADPMLQQQGLPSRLLVAAPASIAGRSEEHTSELQSLMRISYAVFCLKKKNTTYTRNYTR